MTTFVYVTGTAVATTLIFLYGYEIDRLQGEIRVYYEWIEANMRRHR